MVYLATVAEVRERAADMPGATPHMEATLTVGRIFRPDVPPSPPPAEVVVRYESPTADTPGGASYRLKAGERALVFAGSFDPSVPLEMINGSPKTVSVQVAALRAWVAAMDDVTANLHGVTPAIRTRQLALYDRVLAEIGSARTP